MGVVDHDLPVGMMDRSHLDYAWKPSERIHQHATGRGAKTFWKYEEFPFSAARMAEGLARDFPQRSR